MSESKTPPPLPPEALGAPGTGDAPEPQFRVVRGEALVEMRAEELVRVQEAHDAGAIETPPDSTPPPGAEVAAAPGRRLPPRQALWLGSGVAAVLAALALSWAAFRDAGAPARSPSDKPAAPPPAAAPAKPREIRGNFAGFSLLVDSKPAGADVWVDGKPRGRTPSLMNLDCPPGTPLTIRIEKEGYERFEQVGTCKGDAILKLEPKLVRVK